MTDPCPGVDLSMPLVGWGLALSINRSRNRSRIPTMIDNRLYHSLDNAQIFCRRIECANCFLIHCIRLQKTIRWKLKTLYELKGLLSSFIRS